MTISSTTRKAGPFNGNGVTTSFPFTFKVFTKSDLEVVRTMPSGIEKTLVLNSDYSVALNGDQDANPGGTITYPISGGPLPDGWRLTAVGDLDNLQPTDITNGGGFYPQVIENALDRVTMLIQQLEEELGRTIRIAVSDDVTAGLALPAQGGRAARVLGFDADGNFTTYERATATVQTTYRKFTATAGKTSFTLPNTYTPGANSLYVWLNGAKLISGTHFTETTSTSFTLTTGAQAGDSIEAIAGVPLANGTVADSSQVSYTPAGTGAVTRTVMSKLAETISVGDFGDLGGVGTITLNVPSQYATIQAAFNWLANKTITAGSTVTIQVADGTHDYTGAAVRLNHPQGSQIRLVGNEATPASCVLTWTNTASGIDGLVVSDGNVLGYINGFHITRTAHAGTAIGVGLLADNGSVIICGGNITVSNHYYGIAARMGSYIKADGAVVSGAGDVGIWAFVGSTIDCSSATVTSTVDPLQALGFGIQAEYGSTVNCDSASASSNKVAGIAALSGSSVRCHNATANSNTGSGILARDGATVEAHGATTSSNTRYGIEEITNGTVYYTSITQSGNTLGNRLPVAVLNSDSSSLGARLSSASGSLRLDTADANGIFMHTTGGKQFSVAHVASAVNNIEANGSATGSAPFLAAVGSDTNIDASIRGKGTGSVFLGNQQTNYLRVNSSAAGTPALAAEGGTNVDLGLRAKGTGSVFIGQNQTNYVRVNSAASGSNPALYPEGETNLDLILGGKGAGVVRFGTWTSNADAVVNGYVTIKDAAGNVRKLATIA